MSETPHETPPPPQASARRFVMPAVVLGFLGAHMLFVLTAITVAVGDPSFAVVPDYYQKAVDWDEQKAERAASDALGWTVEVIPSRAVSIRGERDVEVVVHDADGVPVTGAAVSVTVYHHARASHVVEADLSPADAPGHYAATLDMRNEGVWDITLRITRGDDRFVQAHKAYVRGAYEGGSR
jgi:nitrogen fixation protein FixH